MDQTMDSRLNTNERVHLNRYAAAHRATRSPP
eukprot:COSAG02_NODE_35943_length_461_cov_0.701657_1_plen_31_part_01